MKYRFILSRVLLCLNTFRYVVGRGDVVFVFIISLTCFHAKRWWGQYFTFSSPRSSQRSISTGEEWSPLAGMNKLTFVIEHTKLR